MPFRILLCVFFMFVCSNALGGQTASQAPESIVTKVSVLDTANPLGSFLISNLSCFCVFLTISHIGLAGLPPLGNNDPMDALENLYKIGSYEYY